MHSRGTLFQLSHVLLLCALLQLCGALDIHYNTTIDCSTPTQHCQFTDPSIWVEKIAPTTTDDVYIVNNDDVNTTYIFLENIAVALCNSLVVTNAVLMVQDTQTSLATKLHMTGGQLIMGNSKLWVQMWIEVDSSSYLLIRHKSTLLSNSMKINGTVNVFDTSQLGWNTGAFGGVVNAHDNVQLSGLSTTLVFGDIFVNSTVVPEFGDLNIQSGEVVLQSGLIADSVQVAAATQLNISSYVSVNGSVALSPDAAIHVSNLISGTPFHNIIQGPIVGGTGATITIESSEVSLGTVNFLSNLSNSIILLKGKSLVHLTNLVLGDVITEDSSVGEAADSTMDILYMVTLTKDIMFSGNIEVPPSALGRLTVDYNVTATLTGCVNSSTQVKIYGVVVCVSGKYRQTSGGLPSVTDVYGALFAPEVEVTGEIYLSGAVLSASTITVSGGNMQVGPSSVVLTDYMKIKSGGVLTLSVGNTLYIQGNVNITDGGVAVTLQQLSIVNGTSPFMAQIQGNLTLQQNEASITVTRKSGLPAATYNLLNSTNPIDGDFWNIAVEGQDTGNIHMTHIIDTQITFDYTPPNTPSGKPETWVIVVIVVAAVVVVAVVAFIGYKVHTRRKQGYARV